MDSEKYRLQIWYEGHVQGVGFRFKAEQIAKGFEISGFVRNLDDGRVHLAAIGDKTEVREYAAELNRVMADFIKRFDEREDTTAKKYAGFNIEL